MVRAQLFVPESATGMASAEAMRVHLRKLRATCPLLQSRQERMRRALTGLAVAFDGLAFGGTAEMLEHGGLATMDVPLTVSVTGTPSTLADELITTWRLVHDDDPVLEQHVANTTAVLTDRGTKMTRSKLGRVDDASVCS